MKIVLRLMMISMLFGVFANVSYAQGEAAVPFLATSPGFSCWWYRGIRSGLADNSAAIFWNPAGIAFLTGTEVSITHSNWLPQFNLDLFYDYLTYRQYIEELDGSVTASITYMNFGEFVRTGEADPTPIGTFRSFDAALNFRLCYKIIIRLGIRF